MPCTTKTCPSSVANGATKTPGKYGGPCRNLRMQPPARFDGVINGKRAQLERPGSIGSGQAPPSGVWVFREYADEPGLFQYLGLFDELAVSHPLIARAVEPYLTKMS